MHYFKKSAFRLIIPVILVLHLQPVAAQMNLEWVKTAGGNGYETGVAMVLDSNKYVISTGSFQESFDLDPGPGTSIITSQGSSDIYIAKHDTAGNLIWVKTFGGPLGDAINNMTNDANGNLYLNGQFQGTADLDPGSGVFNLTTTIVSSYILKLDRNGNFIWAKQIDAGNSQSIAVDTAGNVMTAGKFGGTVDFDPGPGVFNATPTAPLNQDLYVVKLNKDGNFVWMKQLRNSTGDLGDAYGLRTDMAGSIYLSGGFGNTFDFDPGPATASFTPVGSMDIFILKLDKDGNYVWAKQMGGTQFDHALYMEVDGAGNIYTTGGFAGVVDFDPGTAVFQLTAPAAMQNVFISKLDNNGNFVFAKNFASAFPALATGLTLDITGDIYTVGRMFDSLDVDPGPGVRKIGPFGIFLVRLDANGNYNNAGLITTNSYNYIHAIRTDIFRNIYTTSTFGGSPCDFDPGPGVVDLPSVGMGFDWFIHKVSQCRYSSYNSITVSGCGSYVYNGTTYTSSGSYYQILTNAVGCDSIVALNITINPRPQPNLGNDTSICTGQNMVLNAGTFNSYLWSTGSTSNTITVTSPGSYWVQVSNAAACTGSDTVNVMAGGIDCPSNDCEINIETKIYPTPFNDILVIDKNATTCEVRLNLYNALGQLLMRGRIITDGRNEIPLLKLPAGVYFYTLYSGKRELKKGRVMRR